VVCLQEVYEADLDQIKKETGLGFSSFVTNAICQLRCPPGSTPRGAWGVAILSRLPLQNTSQAYYLFPDLKSDDFPDGIWDRQARALAWGTIEREGKTYTIATTHFTWSNNGSETELQKQSLENMVSILDTIGEFVLVGDFNAPRGMHIVFDTLAQKYTDNIPSSVESTLDPELHRVGKERKFVIDGLFSTPGYQASHVQVVTGVSDHCALVASVEKVN